MTKMLGVGLLTLAAVSFATIGLAQTADAPARLKGVKVTELPQSLTVLLETSGPLRYRAVLIDAPARIVIDMDGTYAAPKTRWTPTPEPIKEIRGSQWKPGTARLVVELTRQVSYRIQEVPAGLTLTLEPPRNQRVERATTEAPSSPQMASAASKPDVTPAVAAPSAPKARAKIEPAAAAVLMPLPAAPPPALSRVAQAAPRSVAPAQTAPPRETQVHTPTNGTKPITLDFKEADVINVLRLLSAEGGRNIVVGEDVKGKVSVSLRNVTWEEAMDTILEARGLQRVQKDGVIRIVSNEQLAKEREAKAKAQEALRKGEIEMRTKQAEAELKEAEAARKKLEAELAAKEAAARGPLVEEVIRLAYADPEDVAKTLQGILGIPPTGTAPIQSGPVGVPATPTVVPSGGGVPNPALGELPPLNTPPQPLPWAPPQLVSVSQDVLAKGITIKANKATNSIFLRLYKADMERIKKLVREYLDVPLPQVKIEARMEILDRTALEAIGVQWGGGGAANAGKATLIGQGFEPNFRPPGTGVSNVSPANQNLDLSGLLPVTPGTGLPLGGNLVNLPLNQLPNSVGLLPAAGLAFGIVGTNFNINLALEALATLGKTRTLARPEIVTVENNRATMSLGEEIPYATVSSAGTQIQFKEALLKLEVTPTVIRERINDQEHTKVKMIVVVENNDRGQTVQLGPQMNPPAINRRKAETLVLLNEGQRLVIGGVSTTKNQDTINKVPFLGDIPVFGWLFKQKENFEQGRELVVFVTPTVLNTSVAASVPGK